MAAPGFAGRAGNAYMAVLYEALARTGWAIQEFTPLDAVRRPVEVLHVHFPEHRLDGAPLTRFLRSSAFLGVVAWARLRGARVVWTAHNPRLRENYRTRWGVSFMRLFTRLLHGY